MLVVRKMFGGLGRALKRTKGAGVSDDLVTEAHERLTEAHERLAVAQRLEEAKAAAQLDAKPLTPQHLKYRELSRALSDGVLTGAAAVQAKEKVGGRPSKQPAEVQLTDDEKVALCKHGRANGWTPPAVGGWDAAMLSLRIDSKKRVQVSRLMYGKNPLTIRKAALARAAKKLKKGTTVSS